MRRIYIGDEKTTWSFYRDEESYEIVEKARWKLVLDQCSHWERWKWTDFFLWNGMKVRIMREMCVYVCTTNEYLTMVDPVAWSGFLRHAYKFLDLLFPFLLRMNVGREYLTRIIVVRQVGTDRYIRLLTNVRIVRWAGHANKLKAFWAWK